MSNVPCLDDPSFADKVIKKQDTNKWLRFKGEVKRERQNDKIDEIPLRWFPSKKRYKNEE